MPLLHETMTQIRETKHDQQHHAEQNELESLVNNM